MTLILIDSAHQCRAHSEMESLCVPASSHAQWVQATITISISIGARLDFMYLDFQLNQKKETVFRSIHRTCAAREFHLKSLWPGDRVAGPSYVDNDVSRCKWHKNMRIRFAMID